MNEIVFGLIRHLLTAGGGALATKGIVSADEAGQVIGAIMTIVGVLWSVWHKRQAQTLNAPVNGNGKDGMNGNNRTSSANQVFKVLIVIGCMVSLMFTTTGCKTSAETLAYRSIGTTTTLVDGAMQGWADWVAAGRATDEEQAKVKSAYEKYQAAMRMAHSVVRAWKSAPEGQSKIDTAQKVAMEASDELVGLIRAFTSKTTSTFNIQRSTLNAQVGGN